MKTIMIIMTLALLIVSNLLAAQNNTLPKVNLFNLDGKFYSSLDVLNGEDATIVVFWNADDRNSEDHLTDMIAAHQKLLTTKNVRLVGIYINCNGSMAHVKPYVNGQDWNIEMYVDKNGDFKRAMGVVETPTTFVFNTGNEIVCQYTGYSTGTESLICKKLIETIDASPREAFAMAK